MFRLRENSDGFISGLRQAQAELDLMGHRLDQEFSGRCPASEVNPLNILHRINRLKRDIGLAVHEAEALTAEKEMVNDEMHAALEQSVTRLRALQRRAGIQSDLAPQPAVLKAS